MTARQAEVLAYVTDYISERGISPTLAEIAAALGLRSLSTVHKHLEALREQGRLSRIFCGTRSTTLPEFCPACGRKL